MAWVWTPISKFLSNLIMLDKIRLLSLIPVWMILTITQGRRVTRKLV